MYVDINCINFPFEEGLFAHRETTGNTYELELGGSALNFANMAAKLGLHTSFIGKVGEDIMGDVLIKLLKKNTIHPAVIIDNKVQTNLAIHYIHENGTSIMTSNGNANQSLRYMDIRNLFGHITTQADYFYLGGVFKLKKLLPYLPEIVKDAQTKGMNVVLDHGRINNNVTKEDIQMMQQIIPYVDLYLPSIDEFLAVWDVKTIEEGIVKIHKISKPQIVIKQGDLGAVGFHNNKRIDVPAYPVEVINTVGAGDSFNAGFIKALSDKKVFKEALTYACATAATKISQKTFSIGAVSKLINHGS